MPDTIPYQPKLSRVVTVPDLPEMFYSQQEDLNTVIGYFRLNNLIISKSPSGHMAFYNLDILTGDKLGINIPGTGLALVLNPPDVAGTQGNSSFNVSLFKRHEILKIIFDHDLANFSFTPEAIYSLLIDVFQINEDDIIHSIIDSFVLPDYIEQNPETDLLNVYDHFDTFINDINTNLNAGIDINSLPESPDFSDLFDIIENSSNINFIDIVLHYLQDNIDNLKKLLKSWFSDFDITERIKELIIPEYYAKLNNLSLGLEFPRKVLKPVFSTNNLQDPNYNNNGMIVGEEVDWNGNILSDPWAEEQLPKSTLVFQVGELSASSINGFKFEDSYTASLRKSMILNSGLTLEFSGVKLDLSRTRNIPEATADGRPDDFVGVFVETVEIGLPAKWFGEPDTPQTGAPSIIGRNLIIGTGGISGTIGFDADGILHKKIGDFDISLDAFDITFQQNAITGTDIHGTLKINGFKNASGTQDATIAIDVSFDTDGNFKITAREVGNGIAIQIPNAIEITLKEVSIGRQNDLYYLDISGSLSMNYTKTNALFGFKNFFKNVA